MSAPLGNFLYLGDSLAEGRSFVRVSGFLRVSLGSRTLCVEKEISPASGFLFWGRASVQARRTLLKISPAAVFRWVNIMVPQAVAEFQPRVLT